MTMNDDFVEVLEDTPSMPPNGLTRAQEERLYLLIEECSEVIKCATKVLRFGYDSINPYAPQDGSNLNQLELEMGDIAAVQRLMMVNGDYSPRAVAERSDSKYKKLKTYLAQRHFF